MTSPAPDPVLRPRLALFIWERNLDLKVVAEAIGCSHETVRRLCLPFGDSKRRVPAEELMSRILDWTGGQITAGDFYPPHLNGLAHEPAEAQP